MIAGEVWRPVVGLEGKYEVSNIGRVRSLDWYLWRPPSRRHPDPAGWYQFHKGQLLSLVVGSHGYHLVRIDRRLELVHRLMLAAFVGPCPAGLEALHDDDERLNNSFPNLRWGTRRQNLLDAYRNGRRNRETTERKWQ